MPTVGCAKTFLNVDGLQSTEVKQRVKGLINADAGGHAFLQGQSGKVWAAAFLPDPSLGVTNPIFISTGHMISLKTALAIVKACCRFRIPEPIRQVSSGHHNDECMCSSLTNLHLCVLRLTSGRGL